MNKTVRLPVFDCDGCGACCKHLIIEVDHLDVLREPRIAEKARLLDGRGRIPLEQASWGMNSTAKTDGFGCVFLGEDKKCGIYGTRPNVCVSMQAGSEKCQQARRDAKLAPLAPSGRAATTVLDRIHNIARRDDEGD